MIHTLTEKKAVEPIEFDHDVLAALCDTYGAAAETLIAGTLGDIEDLLVLAQTQLDCGQHPGLARTCRDLRELGGTIGMRTLQKVAGAVLDCIERDDRVALVPCARRMTRLGRADTVAQWTVRRDTVA